MSKKIAILLALAVYCCCHSLAKSHASGKERVKREEPPVVFVLWYCYAEQSIVLGRVCMPWDTDSGVAVSRCEHKLRSHSPVNYARKTDARCYLWSKRRWPCFCGLERTLSCHVCRHCRWDRFVPKQSVFVSVLAEYHPVRCIIFFAEKK